jgi:hypothetical protein
MNKVSFCNQKYYLVRTVPKSNQKIEQKKILATHIYMTTHSPGLARQ